MRIDLTPNQIQRFVKAVDVSYDQDKLEVMLQQQLGRKLRVDVGLPMEWEYMPTKLLIKAHQGAWNGDLILAASLHTPYDEDLVRLAVELGLEEKFAARAVDMGFSAAAPGRLAVSPSLLAKDASLGSLQGLVKKSSDPVPIAVFIARLSRLQHQVCRIETGPTSPWGTGFLVGDDLVLTNRHVADKIAQAEDQARFRFDYRTDAEGLEVEKGFVVELARPGWLVADRLFADSDIGEGEALPTDEELDYALVRIAQPVAAIAPGEKKRVDSLPGRGFMSLDGHAPIPVPEDEIFVLQHPKGEPMKLAVGQVLETVEDPADPIRIRHDSTTWGGSSGSPCFNASLELVALHHATDPADPKQPRYNQAIPIGRILRDLKKLGKI